MGDSRTSQSKTPDVDLINYVAASVFFTHACNKFPPNLSNRNNFLFVSIPKPIKYRRVSRQWMGLSNDDDFTIRNHGDAYISVMQRLTSMRVQASRIHPFSNHVSMLRRLSGQRDKTKIDYTQDEIRTCTVLNESVDIMRLLLWNDLFL